MGRPQINLQSNRRCIILPNKVLSIQAIQQVAEQVEEQLKDTQIFTCTLLATEWTESNGAYTQTVPCTGVLASYNLSAPQVMSTGNKVDDVVLSDTLSTLCKAGNHGETLDAQIMWTCYDEAPASDLTIVMRRVV